MRSSFFWLDFSSRRAVFGCVARVCIAQQTQSSFPDFPISRFPDFPIRGMSRTGLRHCLGLATATPVLAALRPAHEHTRAEHARHARTMRARLASRAHALTWVHTLARQKLDVMLEALATG